MARSPENLRHGGNDGRGNAFKTISNALAYGDANLGGNDAIQVNVVSGLYTAPVAIDGTNVTHGESVVIQGLPWTNGGPHPADMICPTDAITIGVPNVTVSDMTIEGATTDSSAAIRINSGADGYTIAGNTMQADSNAIVTSATGLILGNIIENDVANGIVVQGGARPSPATPFTTTPSAFRSPASAANIGGTIFSGGPSDVNRHRSPRDGRLSHAQRQRLQPPLTTSTTRAAGASMRGTRVSAELRRRA